MNEAAIIFPHQLFQHHPARETARIIFLVETPRFFTSLRFHKYKLILHRASMQAYADEIDKRTFKVVHVPYKDASANKLAQLLKNHHVTTLHYCELIDHGLQDDLINLKKYVNLELVEHQSPSFLTPLTWAQDYFKKKKRFFMGPFYKAQRKRLDILVKNGNPIGGTWSFDQQNRKPFDPKIKFPTVTGPRKNKFVKEAIRYVEKNFAKNPGNADDFFYPVTRRQALIWFNAFLKHRLKLFGDYEDAFSPDEPFLFHSVLSPLLNIGLLTPHEIVNKTLSYAQKHKTPLNCLEGFIRQIIGWREFVRIVYELAGKKQEKSNYFKHRKKLPASYWKATTNILPIDTTIERVLTYAYCHHIERLMVLGNFMLLCEIDPDEVYRWFMELFIDAYDWVMIPNVYGMSQYADGGLMTTKPYMSSSNYLLKMSNYEKNNWQEIWDGLYWRFIKKHKKILSKNPRLNLTLVQYDRADKKKLHQKIDAAQSFLSSFFKRK